MNYFDWIDWFNRWFTPDVVLFWAGVFVGFLFFCFVCIIYDWLLLELQKRNDEK